MSIGARIAVGLVLLLLPLLLLAQETPIVVMNEIMWAKAEYIELYNNTDTDIDLSGWSITRQKTDSDAEDLQVAFGVGDIIVAHGFFLIESSQDATTVPANKIDGTLGLVDPGVLLRLYNQDDSVVDMANQLGAWFAGENNAVGVSMERISSESDGGVAGSWHTSTGNVGGRTGTPGEENSEVVISTPTPTPTLSPTPSPTPTITPTPSATPTVSPTITPPPISYSFSVHINEFLPNPKGDDTVLEFIELFNSSGDEVDVSKWKIDTGGSASFTIPNNTILNSESYLALYRVTTKLSLNNTGNHRVRLLDPSGVVHENVPYSGSKEGYSYNRMSDGSYQQSSTPTPNGENIITGNEEPTPTSSTDDEEDEGKVAGAGTVLYQYSSKIIINEFLPNPTGLDTEQEFIEIKNMDTKAINLLGWKLDDGEMGSSPYTFTSEHVVGPGAIAVFFRSVTKIALNNNADTVRLIDPSGKVVDAVSYASPVPEGQSYARDAQGKFFWSQEVTPDEENTIDVQLQEKKKETTSKLKQAKLASSRTGAVQSAISRSAAATMQPYLAWPNIDEGVVTRTVVGGVRNEPREKQKLFIIFGSIVAVGQFLNGIFSKERIWHKP